MPTRRRWRPKELWTDFKKLSPLKKVAWVTGVIVPLVSMIWYSTKEEPATQADLARIEELLLDTEMKMRDELRHKYPIGYALIWSDGRRTVRDEQGSSDIDWSYAKIGDANAAEGIEVILPRLQVKNQGMVVLPYRIFVPRQKGDEYRASYLNSTELGIQVLKYRESEIMIVIGIAKAEGLSPKTDWMENATRDRL